MPFVRTSLAAGLLAAVTGAPAFADHIDAMHGTRAFALAALNGSGTTGRIALAAQGAGRTTITVTLTGANVAAAPELRVGGCTSASHTFAPLNAAVGGTSTTTVNYAIGKLVAGPFSVAVKAPSGTVACGALGRGNVVGALP